MNEQDIRWIQRFNSYCKALDELKKEVELKSQRELSDLEKKGVIQSFEIVQELSWLLIKDFYESLGETGIQGSLDAFQLAFKRGLLKNPSLMETIESRNNSRRHTYKKEVANEIYHQIIDKYYDAFLELERALLTRKRRKKFMNYVRFRHRHN